MYPGSMNNCCPVWLAGAEHISLAWYVPEVPVAVLIVMEDKEVVVKDAAIVAVPGDVL
jgi:hypothetical protein